MDRLLSVLGFRLGWLTASNDGRCLIFWVLAGLMLLFSVFYGPGEPLLTRTANQQISELAKIDRQDTRSNPWWDADRSLTRTSWSEPIPPAKIASEKSWWPWIMTGILIILATIYTPIAKREEFLTASKDAWEHITARTETEEAKPQTGEIQRQIGMVEKISQRVGWKRLISIDMVSQVAGNFLQRWLFRKR